MSIKKHPVNYIKFCQDAGLGQSVYPTESKSGLGGGVPQSSNDLVKV